jgi:hypothetical protein
MNAPIDTNADYLRNAELAELARVLTDHRSRSVDFVAPAAKMSMRDGALVVEGLEPLVTMNADGVTSTDVNGLYKPTHVGEQGLANVLDIPVRYVRRLADQHPTLLDTNVNEWFGHASMIDKKHLYRALVNPAGDPSPDGYDGVIRAVLSDSYRCIDNFDVLMAVLSGMRNAGIEDPDIHADLTVSRMVVRVTAPGVAIHAPALLANYRNPFDDGARPVSNWTPERLARAAGIEGMGYEPGTEPIVFAGFQISNSETGGGAFRITPRLDIRVCRNGLTIGAESTKEIHLGAKLDVGMIEWSDEVRAANIQLVMAQTTQVVNKFLSREYVQEKVAKLEQDAGIPVKPSDAPEIIANVAKTIRWTQAEQDSILDHFMAGGQTTAGGIMQAVSAVAQTLPGDAAFEMEGQAVRVLALARTVAGR